MASDISTYFINPTSKEKYLLKYPLRWFPKICTLNDNLSDIYYYKLIFITNNFLVQLNWA